MRAFSDVLFAMAEYLPFGLSLVSLGLVGWLTVVCGRERDIVAGLIGLGWCAIIYGSSWYICSAREARGVEPNQYTTLASMLAYGLVFTGVAAVSLILVEACRSALGANSKRIIDQRASTSAAAMAC